MGKEQFSYSTILIFKMNIKTIYISIIIFTKSYNFIFKRSWEKWRMARIQANLSDHVVALGFGISGAQAVHELIEHGSDPGSIVVIDRDPVRLAEAEALGCNVMEADASRDETLQDVRIARARTVLVSAGRDDTTILIVLTVRHLAPDVPISAVVRAEDNELLAGVRVSLGAWQLDLSLAGELGVFAEAGWLDH